MGFKTYTCCICGKEGLTKPQSYAIEGKGRACREHQEAKDAHNEREAKIAEKRAKEQEERTLQENMHVLQTFENIVRKLHNNEMQYQTDFCDKKLHFNPQEGTDYELLCDLNTFYREYKSDKDNVCWRSGIDFLFRIDDFSDYPWTKYIYKHILDVMQKNLENNGDTLCINHCKNHTFDEVTDEIISYTDTVIATFNRKEEEFIKSVLRTWFANIYKDYVSMLQMLQNYSKEHAEDAAELLQNVRDRIFRYEETILHWNEKEDIEKVDFENIRIHWENMVDPYIEITDDILNGTFTGNLSEKLVSCTGNAAKVYKEVLPLLGDTETKSLLAKLTEKIASKISGSNHS